MTSTRMSFVTGSADDIHVVPVNDLRVHDETTRRCWCQPTIELHYHSGTFVAMVVHNSADGRELVEEHGVN